MQNIIKSASKIVFILMAVGATVGFFTGHLSENNFMILAGAAFTFYFSNKGDGSEPYAGK
jgi:putative solute:sodium symporter small subunit